MNKKLLSVAFTAIILDQLSKWLLLTKVFKVPSGGYANSIEIIDFLNLVTVWNSGISFGMFANQQYSRFIFIALAILIIIMVYWWFYKHEQYHIAVGAIIGGAIGNIIDRIIHGAVYDFVDFHIGTWHWPAFNIADAAISIGAIIILIDQFSIFKKSDSKN